MLPQSSRMMQNLLVRALLAEVLAGQRAESLVVGAVFAGQSIRQLDVSAVEHVVLGRRKPTKPVPRCRRRSRCRPKFKPYSAWNDSGPRIYSISRPMMYSLLARDHAGVDHAVAVDVMAGRRSGKRAGRRRAFRAGPATQSCCRCSAAGEIVDPLRQPPERPKCSKSRPSSSYIGRAVRRACQPHWSSPKESPLEAPGRDGRRRPST